MKRGIIFSFLLFFLVFANTKIAFGFGLSSMRQFSGRILNIKNPTTEVLQAKEIRDLEDLGYICEIPGSTFTLKPLGSSGFAPTSFFIPLGMTSQTKNSLAEEELIIGKYGSKIAINCTNYKIIPPVVTQVFLDTVNLFANSIVIPKKIEKSKKINSVNSF